MWLLASGEVLERLQSEVTHPLRLGLELRDLLDDLPAQPLRRLVQIVLGVVEPVALLVVGIDARQLLVLGQDGCFGSSHYSTSSLVCSLLTGFRDGGPRKRGRAACRSPRGAVLAARSS